MAMTCSQKIEELQGGGSNEYEDTITVTDIPKGYFIAITSITAPAPPSTTREVRIDLMAAEWADGGTHSTGTGQYIKQDGETAVKVSVYNGSTLECDNTTNY